MNCLEKIFGSNAQTIVLEHLLKKKGEFTYLSGIALETGLSHSSVARVLEPLIENNLVIEKRLGKQIRTFKTRCHVKIPIMEKTKYINHFMQVKST